MRNKNFSFFFPSFFTVLQACQIIARSHAWRFMPHIPRLRVKITLCSSSTLELVLVEVKQVWGKKTPTQPTKKTTTINQQQKTSHKKTFTWIFISPFPSRGTYTARILRMLSSSRLPLWQFCCLFKHAQPPVYTVLLRAQPRILLLKWELGCFAESVPRDLSSSRYHGNVSSNDNVL